MVKSEPYDADDVSHPTRKADGADSATIYARTPTMSDQVRDGLKEAGDGAYGIDADVVTALVDIDPRNPLMARQRPTANASIITRPVGEHGDLRTASSCPEISFDGRATPRSSPIRYPRRYSAYGANTPSPTGAPGMRRVHSGNFETPFR